MAQKAKGVPAGFELIAGEPMDQYRERQKALYEAACERAAALKDGEIVGGLVSFQVADGYANYLVVSEKPLKLQLIPFTYDGYEVSDAHIRGLRRADVLELVQWRNRWFKPKKKSEAA